MYGYIYKTTNLINKKIYIGQKRSDTYLAEKYLGSGNLIKAAVKKYGVGSFTSELLEWADSKVDLDNKEIYWIKYYDATNPQIGYNIASGGQGGCIGVNTPHIQTDSEKAKRSASLKIAYKEGRHRVIRNTGIKLRKRTLEERKANSEIQKQLIWMHNDSSEIRVFSNAIDEKIASQYQLGRFCHNIAWNKGLTKETSEIIAAKSEERKKLFQERSQIGCFGAKGSANVNYKSDNWLIENVIDKGFEKIWEMFGSESAIIYFKIGPNILNRCLKLCNKSKSAEHTSKVRLNKKNKSEAEIQEYIKNYICK